KKK
ncbi:hypothetical protein PAGU1678_24340, partial [Paraclostridium bifermentans subsp. muricolitidis]